jgi:hypothetical protein
MRCALLGQKEARRKKRWNEICIGENLRTIGKTNDIQKDRMWWEDETE